MAPKAAVAKGSKRSAATSAKLAEPKHARRETTALAKTADVEVKQPKKDPMIQGILDVVTAAQLPDNCRDMLLACVPASFGAYKGERHELQSLAVEMCGEVVMSAKAAMEESVAQANQSLATLEEARDKLVLDVTAAEHRLEEATAAVAACDNEVAESTAAETAAAAKLEEARSAQLAGEASVGKVKADVATLQEAADTQLVTLSEAAPESRSEDGGYTSVVVPLLPLLKLDVSLVTALPSACRKPPSVRGAFDKMVVDQFSGTVREKLHQLLGELAAAAPGCQQRENEVQEAAEALDAAAERKRSASAAAASACEDQKDAASVLKAAKSAVTAHMPARNAAANLRKLKEQELQDFMAYNVSCFEELRERERPTVAAEEQASVTEDAIDNKSTVAKDASVTTDPLAAKVDTVGSDKAASALSQSKTIIVAELGSDPVVLTAAGA